LVTVNPHIGELREVRALSIRLVVVWRLVVGLGLQLVKFVVQIGVRTNTLPQLGNVAIDAAWRYLDRPSAAPA
jgi:hypothetical protein